MYPAARLSFTTSTSEGVEKSHVIFIAVPTPPLEDVPSILVLLKKSPVNRQRDDWSTKIVVDKSTVPFNTGDKVA
jgi:UDPglucose 6-dehydrogenase